MKEAAGGILWSTSQDQDWMMVNNSVKIACSGCQQVIKRVGRTPGTNIPQYVDFGVAMQ